jgi:type II secretory pathway pseudopilin PulG
MKIRITFPNQRSHRRPRGMTLIELLVAVGIGFVLLMVMATIFASSNRMFANVGNYVSLDQASEQALERMTRDIRKCQDLVSFATNQIQFKYSGTTKLTFTYNPVSRQLIRSMTGQADTCLMQDCDFLEFSMYKNAPLTGGTIGQTTSPGLGKCIRVTWQCSRTVTGVSRDSENIEQALIVIRNKPVL